MAEQSRGPSFQSHERPPGPSSSPVEAMKYDVFLNLLGRDETDFMSCLYDKCRSAGLNPFLDKKSLAKGDEALGSIDGALAEASVHVVVMTARNVHRYRNGLYNLVAMMESGKPVIPVYYGVEPWGLWLKGSLLQDIPPLMYGSELNIFSLAMGEGKSTMEEGKSTMEEGNSTMEEGKGTMEEGKGTMEEGKGTMEEGKSTMEEGKSTMEEGKRTMEEGKGTMEEGKGTMEEGKSTMEEGKSTMEEGKSTWRRRRRLQENECNDALMAFLKMDGFMVLHPRIRDFKGVVSQVVDSVLELLMPIEVLKAYPTIKDVGIDEATQPTCDQFTTRVLGVLDIDTDDLEFYFENRENMANIVGVGLEYGKAIVKPGSCIKAVEIEEEEWKYIWSRIAGLNTNPRMKVLKVALPMATGAQVYVNRGHEDRSDLGTSSSNDGIFQEHALGNSNRQVQVPFLWELSKYFIVKHMMDEFCVQRDIQTQEYDVVHFTQEYLGSQSRRGGVTRSPRQSGKSLEELLSNLSVDSKSNRKKQGGSGDDGDDGDDGDGNKDGDDSDGNDSHDGHSKGKKISSEWKVIISKVKIKLRSGGEFFDNERKPLPYGLEQSNYGGNLVIEPFLSLDFQKTMEETGEVDKEILCTVGHVSFCLNRNLDYFDLQGRFGWFHDELHVSFGPKSEDDTEVTLLEESEVKDYMDGKIRNKASSSKEAGISHERGVKGKLVVGNNNIARIEVGGDFKKVTHGSNSQSHGQDLESSCKQTEGGFFINPRRMPPKAKLEYCYSAPSREIILEDIKDPSYREWLSHSPLCREQRTKYSCGWYVIGDADGLMYNFKALRKMRMLKSEVIVEESEHSTSALISSLKKKMKRKISEEVKISIQESAPVFQMYEKDILINLAMTHLVDGKTFKLIHGSKKQPNWSGGVHLVRLT